MRCIKNGIIAVWGGTHCYAGDAFECPQCKAQTLVCSQAPFHNENALENGGLNMDGWGEEIINRKETE